MSSTQDKRLQRKIDHAEFLWQQAQLKAALANTDLDLAVETFKDLTATEEQVAIQKNRIEEYLMSEKEAYLERIGIQQD